jgi:hypothetical protein
MVRRSLRRRGYRSRDFLSMTSARLTHPRYLCKCLTVYAVSGLPGLGSTAVKWRGVRLGWRCAGWPRDVVHASTWAFGAVRFGECRASRKGPRGVRRCYSIRLMPPLG